MEAWELDAIEQILKAPAINVDETSLRVDKLNHWLRLRTLQRWRQPDTLKSDGRTQRQFTPGNKLTGEEWDTILTLTNSEEFKNRTPHQIVPMLAERGDYIASESSFYRVLREENQLKHRHASRAANPHSKPKALTAAHPIRSIAGTSPTWQRWLKGSSFISTFLWIFSAAKLSVGRSTTRKVAVLRPMS